MNIKFFQYTLVTLFAAGFISASAHAKDLTDSTFILQILHQKAVERSTKFQEKNYTLHIDKDANSVTVKNNRETVVVTFPHQDNSEIEIDEDEDMEELSIDYGFNPFFSFELFLDIYGKIDIDDELNALVAMIRDLDDGSSFTWSWERTDRLGYVDIALKVPYGQLEDELDFDLENDPSTAEQVESEEFCHFRYVITKRNIYTFFTAGRVNDQHLHEEFVNSLQIK